MDKLGDQGKATKQHFAHNTRVVSSGCERPAAAGSEIRVTASHVSASPKAVTEKIYGEYQKNAAVMPIKDVVYFLAEEGTKLVVIQASSSFTEEERNRLKSGESDFMVLVNKESPSGDGRGWYPYLVTEIKFKSQELSVANIDSFYLKAYGIEEANTTDNINSYQDEEHFIKKLEFDNGLLSLEYSGASEIYDDKHSWKVSL